MGGDARGLGRLRVAVRPVPRLLGVALGLAAGGAAVGTPLFLSSRGEPRQAPLTLAPATVEGPGEAALPIPTRAAVLTANVDTDIPLAITRRHNNPLPSVIRSGPATVPAVAVTIDDVFGPTGTAKLAEVLEIAKARGVHLTLFPTGGALRDARDAGQQDVWRRAVRDGHEIGNHTFTHSRLPRLSDQEIRDELTSTQDMLNEVLGPEFDYRMRLLRPPGGAGGLESTGDPRIMRVATEMGYSLAMWGIDSSYTDGFSSYVSKIVGPPGARNGTIVLLHFTTFSPANVATLIDRLRAERHLELRTVSELFPP